MPCIREKFSSPRSSSAQCRSPFAPVLPAVDGSKVFWWRATHARAHLTFQTCVLGVLSSGVPNQLSILVLRVEYLRTQIRLSLETRNSPRTQEEKAFRFFLTTALRGLFVAFTPLLNGKCLGVPLPNSTVSRSEFQKKNKNT